MKVEKRHHEASFTLLETIMAMAIMSTVILQVVATQGKIVYFSGYNRMSSEAMWYAKRVMAQVEYNWAHYDFKELNSNLPIKDGQFENEKDLPFTYDLNIDNFQLPLVDLLFGTKANDSGIAACMSGARRVNHVVLLHALIRRLSCNYACYCLHEPLKFQNGWISFYP